MSAATWGIYVATAWFAAALGMAAMWHALKTGVRRRQIRRDAAGASWMASDHGFGLVEVVVAIALLGIVAVPVSNLAIALMRSVASAERAATRVALASTGASVASTAPVDDPCTPDALTDAVAARVSVPDGYRVAVVVDCSSDPLVITVTATDPTGAHAAMVAARTCQEDEACWDCSTMGNQICGP